VFTVLQADAEPPHPGFAIFLTVLFFIGLFVVIRWLTKRAPDRNSNPAERNRDLENYYDRSPPGSL
jgi:hypothetical protein